MDDMVNTLHDNHLTRLRLGLCSTQNGILFLDVLSNLERISDTCSNVGISVVARVNPELASLAHNYVTSLHQGKDQEFNQEYQEAHDKYFSMLETSIPLDKMLNEIESDYTFSEGDVQKRPPFNVFWHSIVFNLVRAPEGAGTKIPKNIGFSGFFTALQPCDFFHSPRNKAYDIIS